MIDNHRILCIHNDPASATPEEIQRIAELAHEHQRTRGALNLRDHFAMAALTGLHAGHPKQVHSHNDSARLAYKAADAMLEARLAVKLPA